MSTTRKCKNCGHDISEYDPSIDLCATCEAEELEVEVDGLETSGVGWPD